MRNPNPVRRFLREDVRRLYDQTWVEGYLEGLAISVGETLLRLLQLRDLPVTEEQRLQIAECRDHPTLHRWLRRAPTVAVTDELFAP